MNTMQKARLDEEVTDARDDVTELGTHVLIESGLVTPHLFWKMATRIDQLTERVEELEARA